jgi:flagellar basal body-associated protein FliL
MQVNCYIIAHVMEIDVIIIIIVVVGVILVAGGLATIVEAQNEPQNESDEQPKDSIYNHEF